MSHVTLRVKDRYLANKLGNLAKIVLHIFGVLTNQEYLLFNDYDCIRIRDNFIHDLLHLFKATNLLSIEAIANSKGENSHASAAGYERCR